MARLREHPELLKHLRSLEDVYGATLEDVPDEDLAPLAALAKNESKRAPLEGERLSVAAVQELADKGYSINQIADELGSYYLPIKRIMNKHNITVQRFYTVRDNRGNMFENVTDAAEYHRISIASIRQNRRRDGLRFEFGQWPIK